jgi:uncharacterized protein (DUF58 family)
MPRAGRDLRRVARTSSVLTWIESAIGLTPSGLALVILAAGGWIAARLIGSFSLFLLVYGLMIVLGISWFLGRRKLAVEATRSDLPGRVREGQLVDVALSLAAKRRLSTIILEETLDPHLGTTVRVPVAQLPPGQQVDHAYGFTPRLRGVFKIGPLVASWSDPFGLTRRTQTLSESVEIIVHPSTEPVRDRVLSREWEDPPVRPPDSKPWPSGFEFYGMRDYVAGDDPRRIVWRATARYLDLDDPSSARYLVRESEQGITDRISLIFDTNDKTHSPGDPSETFETAVRVVASLGSRHIKDGFAVTVETNAGRIADQLRGTSNGIRLLDALARVQRERVPFAQTMQRLMTMRRTDTHLVVVSPHIDAEIATRLSLLRRRGISILVVHVMWADTDPASVHRAASLGLNVVEVDARTPFEGVFRKAVGAGRKF